MKRRIMKGYHIEHDDIVALLKPLSNHIKGCGSEYELEDLCADELCGIIKEDLAEAFGVDTTSLWISDDYLKAPDHVYVYLAVQDDQSDSQMQILKSFAAKLGISGAPKVFMAQSPF